jgi:hypothetical protein
LSSIDPLSITTSIIIVVQITNRIIDLYKVYITRVRDTLLDLRVILIEVSSVKYILKVIELLNLPRDIDSSIEILEKL